MQLVAGSDSARMGRSLVGGGAKGAEVGRRGGDLCQDAARPCEEFVTGRQELHTLRRAREELHA
jgi:hypothetical protein